EAVGEDHTLALDYSHRRARRAGGRHLVEHGPLELGEIGRRGGLGGLRAQRRCEDRQEEKDGQHGEASAHGVQGLRLADIIVYEPTRTLAVKDTPTVILGAGAAGLMAAIFAAGRSRRVVVLERTRDGGRKILVSGGGRCNILPSVTEPSRFVTDSSPNTLRKILTSWPLAEQRRFFEEEAGIPLALEAETGKLFPASNSAREVRDKLMALARRRGAEIRFNSRVVDLASSNRSWTVRLENGEAISASAVIVATGGLSLPGTG